MNKTEQFSCYKFKTNDIKKLWSLLENQILESIIGKITDKKKTKVNRSKIILSKGADAKFAADKKKFKECILFVAEGDSALGLVE